MRRLENVQTLTEEERRMLREVKQAVLQHAPGAEVILYGSAARGERGPESDYDVLVLLPEQPTTEQEDRISGAVYDAVFDYDMVVVSTITLAREEWSTGLVSITPYHGNVEREGVVL